MPLPPGYTLRRPAVDEAPAIQALLDACESFDTGEERPHEQNVATDWKSPRCHPDEDWWVVDGPAGDLAGVGYVWPETAGEVTADHYVHPDHRGRGLGEALLDIIEGRVAELPPRAADGRIRRLTVWCEDSDQERRSSLERRGFTATRQYFEMVIDLSGGVPAPVWPAGIQARGFRAEVDAAAVHEAHEDAFSEHHLWERQSLEEWRLFHLDSDTADPGLWWLAWDGEELAGFLTALEKGGEALVNDLAVRRAWRARGIGKALLWAAFATFAERGLTTVRLFVDAQNVTDAVRVYEAAGMHVDRRFDVMERPLA